MSIVDGVIGLDETLGQLGYELVIKLHHYHAGEASRLLRDARHIRLFEGGSDLYRYLNDTAVLITDYSSVANDFLKTGRPMVFAPFDLAEYLASEARGNFYEPYESFAVGPVCADWNEVGVALVGILRGQDAYAVARGQRASRVLEYSDGNSCQRTTAAVELMQ